VTEFHSIPQRSLVLAYGIASFAPQEVDSHWVIPKPVGVQL